MINRGTASASRKYLRQKEAQRLLSLGYEKPYIASQISISENTLTEYICEFRDEAEGRMQKDNSGFIIVIAIFMPLVIILFVAILAIFFSMLG